MYAYTLYTPCIWVCMHTLLLHIHRMLASAGVQVLVTTTAHHVQMVLGICVHPPRGGVYRALYMYVCTCMHPQGLGGRGPSLFPYRVVAVATPTPNKQLRVGLHARAHMPGLQVVPLELRSRRRYDD